MTRELDPQQAFQTHCLAQMGVTSWLSSADGEPVAVNGIAGMVYMPPQPWLVNASSDADPVPSIAALSKDVLPTGFAAAAPEPIAKVLPEEKEQSVAYLREQLNAGPEIIVEDLQPIEELAVDIVVEPEIQASTRMTQLDVRSYALANKLLIISDVPKVFSQEEEVAQLALKMGTALLKQPVDEWQSSALSWPGGLKNPQFLARTDWLLGALESYILRLLKTFPETPKLVLAGNQIVQLMEDLPADSPIKSYPVACIVSLPELHRIPELRKEAWQIMQTRLFRSDV
ncbi:hypothetical protein [Marinomonas transparens]|uniref:Uncharacterized protein n=1 Tax=Marinomonas transparens TaxID=2795388 RepID=A0A934JKU7_9GAMM|nr:hypothetical protein [Marinomonas transparens]MBJ7537990.1 hypothetical protein [Marinomonas transparens]